MNAKYQIPPPRVEVVVTKLHRSILDHIPTKEVSTLVIVEEFYNRGDDLTFQRQYDLTQLENGRIKGKPRKIALIKMVPEFQRIDFGFTHINELRKILEFTNYKRLGMLTQIKTCFMIADDLIEIPIALSETNELGVFLEIGFTTGPISNIQQLLRGLQSTLGIQQEWLQSNSYPDLLSARTVGVAQ